MKKISADKIFSGAGDVWTDRVLILDDAGKVLEVAPRAAHDSAGIEHHQGALVPGFVNAHCHLELSHMKGIIPTGTGLLPFLRSVVTLRDFDPAIIEAAIVEADREMYDSGIVAVGDISNKSDTARTKDDSPIHYHSFVEVFDFMQDNLAQAHFDKAVTAWREQSDAGKNKKTLVPHAPYSVSDTLLRLINNFNDSGTSISVHNQETAAENEMFLTGGGDFIRLWESFGFEMSGFQARGKNALQHLLGQMRTDQRLLLVHNTMTTDSDIRWAQERHGETYWVSCPNANLYIENRLPRYEFFMKNNARVCLGTDSLSSNWQLSILEEMKTVQRYQSGVMLADLVRWACLNGACALGYEDELGSFEAGKRPGVNLIDLAPGEDRLEAHHRVRRLV